jgi:hypothetical protein
LEFSIRQKDGWTLGISQFYTFLRFHAYLDGKIIFKAVLEKAFIYNIIIAFFPANWFLCPAAQTDPNFFHMQPELFPLFFKGQNQIDHRNKTILLPIGY